MGSTDVYHIFDFVGWFSQWGVELRNVMCWFGMNLESCVVVFVCRRSGRSNSSRSSTRNQELTIYHTIPEEKERMNHKRIYPRSLSHVELEICHLERHPYSTFCSGYVWYRLDTGYQILEILLPYPNSHIHTTLNSRSCQHLQKHLGWNRLLDMVRQLLTMGTIRGDGEEKERQG